MKFQILPEENYNQIKVNVEKLDSAVAPELKSQIVVATNAGDDVDLIIDLSNVTFADSSGLSAILLAFRICRDSGNHLVIFGVQDRIMKLLEISRLTESLTIVNTLDEAVIVLKELRS